MRVLDPTFLDRVQHGTPVSFNGGVIGGEVVNPLDLTVPIAPVLILQTFAGSGITTARFTFSDTGTPPADPAGLGTVDPDSPIVTIGPKPVLIRAPLVIRYLKAKFSNAATLNFLFVSD